MKKLFTSEKVYAGKSGISGAGRGVYARCDIKKGEIVERCPLIEVPKGDMASLGESVLVTYFFYFGRDKERVTIALGYGSLYNHSYKPNVSYEVKPREKVIEFVAIDDIEKDGEMTFNYSGSKKLKSKRSLWFEV